MSGFDNEVLNAINVDFRGVKPVVAQMTANGQLLIGSAAAPFIRASTLSSSDASVTITNGPGTIDLKAAGSSAYTIDTDAGLVTSVANNFDVLGSGSIATSGAGTTVTVALTGLTNHALLIGAGTSTVTKLGPNATAGKVLQSAGAGSDPAFSTPTYPSASGTAGQIIRSDGTNNLYTTATYPNTTTSGQLLYSSAANTVGGLASANNATLITSAAGVPSFATLTDGQIIIGSSAGAPIATTITQGANISITNGPNSITIAATAGGGTVTSVSGTLNRITSTGGNTPVIDISAAYVGQTSLTTLGTVTTGTWNADIIPLQYGGTSANLTASNGGIFYSTAAAGAILAGTATARQMLQSGATAAPAWSTATWPATTTINQLLYSSSANTVAGLATGNNAVLTTGATGVPVMTTLAADGSLLIGSAGGPPVSATITAGTGIVVTNGSNTITISTAGTFTWNDVTGALQTLAVGNGYVTDRGAGVTYSLPATAAFGDQIKIAGKLGLASISQAAGQSIRLGNQITTVGIGGSMTANNVGDCLELVCVTAGASTAWTVINSVGNWTIV